MAQNITDTTASSRAIRPLLVCLSMLCLLLVSCGDASVVSVGGHAHQSEGQAISLVPEFSLNGGEAMPETVYFSELGLSIAEIRLEPLSASSPNIEQSSIVYSTRNAIRLDFDVAEGEKVIFGQPLELPHAGRYLISVRLEPVARVEPAQGTVNEVISPSFRVEGFVSTAELTRTERGRLDENSDGSPTPMPFDEDKDSKGDGQSKSGLEIGEDDWTPFHYDSRQSVFISLNEIEIGRDSEFLSFEFDMNEWAESLAIPLRDAVRENDSATPSTNRHGVDVTSRLEDSGHGAETLLNSARVSSLAQRH